MTPAEIRACRKRLALSAERFARLTGTSTGRTVRRWEAGQAPVPQSVQLILGALDAVPGMKEYLDSRALIR